jgi:hypothetical protein
MKEQPVSTTSENLSAGTCTTPARRDDVMEYPVDAEAVLFDPTSRNMYVLNESALSVWRMCDGRTTVHEMAGSHMNVHAVDVRTARDDIDRLLGSFAAVNLLVPGSTDAN